MAGVAEALSSNLHYWLVDHPTITNFEWVQHHTFGASPQFLLTSIISYLSLISTLHLILLKWAPHLPSPTTFRFISALHNIIILTLSLTMAVGCSLSSLSQMPHPSWLFCFPTNSTPPKGPVFFWAYVFYLSKIIEFSDTLLILINPSRKSLSFLHVYHHAVVVMMSYLWLHSSQSLLPIALVTNASVHTLMYSYYLLCSIGVRPRWKRAVTDCQITQFVFSFAASTVFLWYHFNGGGCSGFGAWVFNALFNVSLLALFVNFYLKNYWRGEGGVGKKMREKRDD
ncbi:hypothetical protein AAC387_Pa11g1546 [Persea americana]